MKTTSARTRQRFDEQFHSPERCYWLKSWGCVVKHCHNGLPLHIHHVRSRGAGGTWKDTLPLCRNHHREIHDTGVETFAAKYDIDLAERAAEFVTRWENGDEAF